MTNYIKIHFLKIATVTLTLSPASWKLNLLERYYSTKRLCEDISKSMDICRATAMTKFFSKNSHNYLDLEPSSLKVELARDIIIPNIYVVISKSIEKCRQEGDYKVLFFFFFLFCFVFSKYCHSYLNLEPSSLKVVLYRDMITPNNCKKIH